MRNKLFRWLSSLIVNHYGKVLLAAFLFTILMIMAAGRLTMKNNFSDMLPQEIPQVQAFEKIIKDFSSDSMIMLTVESKDKNINLMKKCAAEMAEEMKTMLHVSAQEGQSLSIIKKVQLLTAEPGIKLEGVKYDTTNLVKRIDVTMDIDFFKEHGLIIQKARDLENFTAMYSSLELPDLVENINNNFEKEYVEDLENLASLDGETQAIQGLEGIYKFVRSIGDYMASPDSALAVNSVDNLLFGQDHMISSDNTVLLLFLQPTNSSNDYDKIMELGSQVNIQLAGFRERYPDLIIGGSGLPLLGVEEMDAIKKDFGWPSLLALFLILIILIGSFRSWKNPFNSVLTLTIALIWVTGILALVLHYINMMSASFGVILIGLGIDFGIHFISGFRDGREQGLDVKDSVYYMYDKVGSGVITGAITTASVFFTLLLTGFNALQQMGVAMGVGIIVALGAMMILLPALIVWDHKGYSATGNFLARIGLRFLTRAAGNISKSISRIFDNPLFNAIGSFMQFRFMEKVGKMMSHPTIAVVVLILTVISVAFSLKLAGEIEFEYDMMELEPKGMPSVINQDKIIDKFEMTPDFAMFTVNDPEACRSVVKKLKRLADRTELIGRIDAITEMMPSRQRQQQNILRIDAFVADMAAQKTNTLYDETKFQKLQQELYRLHQNIAEIGELSIQASGEDNKIIKKCDDIVGQRDENSKILALIEEIKAAEQPLLKLTSYQQQAGPVLKKNLLKMASREIVTLANMPEKIRERYINDTTKNLLVTIYPKSNIWNEKNLRKFTDKTREIDENITGTPAIMLLFIDMMGDKATMATGFGLLAVLIILFLDFLSIKYTVVATIPLLVGAIWMLGIMALLGMKFNYNNLMAVPIIIGIGIDDGVHILHRYKLEGKNSMALVLRFTGRAILLTSLTTMIGFGSLATASHIGLATMGELLFIGVGGCFISSTFVLPSIITIYEKIKEKKVTTELQ